MMDRIFPVLLAVVLLAGCTWVKPTTEGQMVRVATVNEVSGCTRLGKTTVSLKDKIVGIERNREKVKGELETLARNSGAEMGGNTVVAETQPKDGRQTFGVYKCNR